MQKKKSTSQVWMCIYDELIYVFIYVWKNSQNFEIIYKELPFQGTHFSRKTGGEPQEMQRWCSNACSSQNVSVNGRSWLHCGPEGKTNLRGYASRISNNWPL